MKSCIIIFILSLISLNIAENPSFPRSEIQQIERVRKSLLNINNWSYWVRWDGISGNDPTGDPGGIFPRGTSNMIYSDGFVWGGYTGDGLDRKLHVGGSTYISGLVSGWIMQDGKPVDQADPRVKIYRIRSDWASLENDDKELRREAADFFMVDTADVTQDQMQDIFNQYKSDWENWPVDLGAPYYDKNRNGIFDDLDEPGIADANQVIWFVCNDLDAAQVSSFSGSDPIGIELQTTIWCYLNQAPYLDQTVFKKYRLTNKSANIITDMYVTQWSDPDVGYYADDFVGCDTLLDLAYAYNGSANDSLFDKFEIPPPAIGYTFLEATYIAPPTAKNTYIKTKTPDEQKIELSSFGYFAAGSPISDPGFGTYDATLQWYNLMRGYTPTTDIENPTPFKAGFGPNMGEPTKYPLSGNPLLVTGDIDGKGNNMPPGDRRMLFSCGPLNMVPESSRQFVVAIIGGINTNGDQLKSVEDLKFTVAEVRTQYENLISTLPGEKSNSSGPVAFNLMQNYPNPFNPETRIEFSIVNRAHVNISIYNVLGQLIHKLADNEFSAGSHSRIFNASNLPSGIYFYRINVRNTGGNNEIFNDVRKMMLLR
jgi:hypothetical protein